MQKDFLEKQRQRLEKQKEKLEGQLNSFADQSEKDGAQWDARMPSYDKSGNLEEEADEVEEFGMRLALEKTLEQELKKVNLALEKIKKGKYGLCEKCNKPISQGRLKAYPRAEHCLKCQ